MNALRAPLRIFLQRCGRALALPLLASIVVLAACGGGGSGGVDTGGTGAPVASLATGRIAGFGSIVVNDVHYDDESAEIVDDDGRARRREDLQLGMTVQVQAGPIERDPAADVRRSTALRIAFGSEIRGPVESVDSARGTLRVIGQTVTVDVNTVIAGFASLASIRGGDLVEVFAFFDPSTGIYAATRIEREATLASFRLRGPIAALDTAGRTLRIGGATISYANVPPSELPGLQNGVVARVEVQTAAHEGRWIATRIVTPLPAATPEGVRTELEGFITDFTSRARFKVDGVAVDASRGDVVFDKGSAAQLAEGARIEVEGRVEGGVLIAERIEVHRVKDAPAQAEAGQEFDVRGAIEAVDAGARRFVVRGLAVTFDANTRFDDGAAGDLRPGAVVRVRGTLSGGNQLRADRIRFDD